MTEENLTLVEQNCGFVDVLKDHFPEATVAGDTAGIARMPQASRRLFGAAICGLGFRNMPIAQVHEVLEATFSQIRDDAPLFMFTYGRRCSVPTGVLEGPGLTSRRIGMTLRNLPPDSGFSAQPS